MSNSACRVVPAQGFALLLPVVGDASGNEFAEAASFRAVSFPAFHDVRPAVRFATFAAYFFR